MADQAWWAQPWAQTMKHVLLAIAAVGSVAAAVVPQFYPPAAPAAAVVQQYAGPAARLIDEAIPTPRQPAPPEQHCLEADTRACRVATWLSPPQLERCNGRTWEGLGPYDGGTGAPDCRQPGEPR